MKQCLTVFSYISSKGKYILTEIFMLCLKLCLMIHKDSKVTNITCGLKVNFVSLFYHLRPSTCFHWSFAEKLQRNQIFFLLKLLTDSSVAPTTINYLISVPKKLDTRSNKKRAHTQQREASEAI